MIRVLSFVLVVVILFSQFGEASLFYGVRDYTSDLVTNYHGEWHPSENVVVYQQRNRVFDLGYIVYTKEFSDRYGFTDEFVTDELSEGMSVMEFRMRTKGGYTVCFLNVLIDKNIGLDLPEKNYVSRGNKIINGFGLHKKRPDYMEKWKHVGSKHESQEERDWRIEKMNGLDSVYYNRNTAMASLSGNNSARFEEYDGEYYSDKDFLSIGVFCKPYIFEGVNPEFWYKKKGMPDLRKYGYKEKYYKKFKIPKIIAEKASEYIRMNGIDSHFKTIRNLEANRKAEHRKRLGIPKQK